MGWNIERFIEKEKIKGIFLCSICTDVVQDARQTPCQHLYCEACIKQWLDGGQRTCPEDRQQLRQEDLKPMDRSLRQFIDDFIVKCKNHRDGCRLMARYEDMAKLMEHESNQCDAGNCNTIRTEIEKYKNEVVQLKNKNKNDVVQLKNKIDELQQHISVIEKGKNGQVEMQTKIQKKLVAQTENLQMIVEMVSNHLEEGRNLSNEVELLCKKTSGDCSASSSSMPYSRSDDNNEFRFRTGYPRIEGR